jgi:hypothetical protein
MQGAVPGTLAASQRQGTTGEEVLYMSWQRLLTSLFCAVLFLSQLRAQVKTIALTGVPTKTFVPRQTEPVIVTFTSLSTPIITERNSFAWDVAYGATVVGQDGDEHGFWAGPFLIAKENSPLPVNLSGTIRANVGRSDGDNPFGPLKLLVGLYPVFRAHLRSDAVTTESDTAIYRRSSDSTVLTLREGDALNPFDRAYAGDFFEVSHGEFETALSQFPVRAAAGNIGFYSAPGFAFEGDRLYGPGDLQNIRPLGSALEGGLVFRMDNVIVRASEGSRNIVARVGQKPSIAPDVSIVAVHHPGHAFLDRPRTDARAIFAATIEGTTVTASTDSAIFVAPTSNGALLVLREGTQVPGRDSGIVFGDLKTDNIIGAADQRFMFNTQLVGPGIAEGNDWALASWSAETNTGSILAQEGVYVSGLPAGSVLTGLDGPHFQFNLAGQSVFNAQFVGPNGNGHGLFYASIDEAQPSLIVRTGQDFDIGGGNSRTISDIGLVEMSSPWDGRASQLNDAGQATFNLTFTDGSQGIFTTTVPEPATIWLSIVAGLPIVGHQFRRRRSVRRTT